MEVLIAKNMFYVKEKGEEKTSNRLTTIIDFSDIRSYVCTQKDIYISSFFFEKKPCQ